MSDDMLRKPDAARKINFLSRPGMPVSLGLHAAVLIASVVTFSQPKVLPDAIEAVSVEVIDESQIREVTKGETSAKQAAPTPRVDRVDEKKEQNAPGEAKKQVNADNTPKAQEATAKEERKEVAAVVPPPPPRPVIVPPKPADPPKPAEAPKPVAVKPVKPAESTDEEEDEADEIVKQAKKKTPEPPKPDQAALAKLLEQQKAEEQKKAEDAKRRQEQAAEQRRQEQARETAREEARKAEQQKKLAEAKVAEDQKKAEDAKKAQEAAKKAADEKRKRDAEQQARNKANSDAVNRALLASREAPANSGNTGQQVSRTPAAGAPTATGQRLNPSDRAALVSMIRDQINPCWNNPVSSRPPVLPLVRVALNPDGSLGGTPVLINSSGDPSFRALADSGMRAIRQCAPFRIPARFAATYGDWRSIVVQLDPEN
ncbi:MAG: cell envelope integrity protein TolA [Beijerinckiaceae bacterium]